MRIWNKRNRVWKVKETGRIIALAMGAVLAAGQTGCGKIAAETAVFESKSEAEAESGSGVIQASRPQDNYYLYINQDTILDTEIRYGDVYGGPIAEVSEQIDEEIISLIRDIALSDKDPDVENDRDAWAVKGVYLQYLEYLQTLEGQEIQDFAKKKLEEIQNITQIEDLYRVMEDWVRGEGFPVIFEPCVDRNFYYADRNAVYLEQKTSFLGVSLKDIYEGDEMRKTLHSFVFDTLCACGEAGRDADKKADDLVYLAMDIAFDTDYEKMEAVNPFLTFTFYRDEELDDMLKNINAAGIEKIYGMEDNPYGGFYVQDEKQLMALCSKLTGENLETWKTYLICEFFYRYRSFLCTEFPYLNFYVETSYRALDEQAALYVNELLPETVSNLYVRTYYTDGMDAFLDRMYQDITDSYRSLISGADWLSEKTRQGLIKKLENMQFVKSAENGKLSGEIKELKDSALETFVYLKAAQYREELKKIGQPHDKSGLILPAQVMNAAYSTDNTFTVTVAIMHAPYYDEEADYYTNLGGIGMVMAHEIGHAFDSNCIVFDPEGNYDPDWIDSRDQEVLRERAEKMADYYSAFTVMDIYHVDGEKTLGENYADKGGMECLMNLTNSAQEREKIFENYAAVWCMVKEDLTAVEQLTEDEHSPEAVRVNAVLSSTEEFYELYKVRPGDGMYLEPEMRVSRWK